VVLQPQPGFIGLRRWVCGCRGRALPEHPSPDINFCALLLLKIFGFGNLFINDLSAFWQPAI
jgi:hypothetical protein